MSKKLTLKVLPFFISLTLILAACAAPATPTILSGNPGTHLQPTPVPLPIIAVADVEKIVSAYCGGEIGAVQVNYESKNGKASVTYGCSKASSYQVLSSINPFVMAYCGETNNEVTVAIKAGDSNSITSYKVDCKITSTKDKYEKLLAEMDQFKKDLNTANDEILKLKTRADEDEKQLAALKAAQTITGTSTITNTVPITGTGTISNSVSFEADVPQWTGFSLVTYSDPALTLTLGKVTDVKKITVYEQVRLAGGTSLKISPDKNVFVGAGFVCRPVGKLVGSEKNPDGCEVFAPKPVQPAAEPSFDVASTIITQQSQERFSIETVGKIPSNTTVYMVTLAGEILLDGSFDGKTFYFTWPKSVTITSEAYSIRFKSEVTLLRLMYVKPLPPK